MLTIDLYGRTLHPKLKGWGKHLLFIFNDLLLSVCHYKSTVVTMCSFLKQGDILE